MTFSKIKLNQNLQKAILDLGFLKPTPIQEKVIPFLINHKDDLIALAQTGTGKTAAFGIPIIQKIDAKKKYPQTIILCPTRELCLQITKDMESYAKYTDKLIITAVYGGSNIQSQINKLNSGSQIIIGTPGRVVDLIKRRKLKLNNINFLVLDEADEMLNMGFKDDLDTILDDTPKEKQTLLFSATMPKEVLRISKKYMYNPETIAVAKRNEGAKNVEHHYYMVNARDKFKSLRRICDIHPDIYSIIFCRTRRETADIANKLLQEGYNADAIHGELSQAQRDYVMGRFREKKIQLLVATDVAARGIDINELTHVINYNLPDDNEVYIHRSGRTGRAGNKGVSIIIAHNRDGRKLKSIEKMLKKKLTLKKVPNGEEICHIQLIKLIDNIIDTKINTQIDQYFPTIKEKLSHFKKDELIKHFVSVEFNRFLSFYKDATDLNVTKEVSKKNKNNYRNKKTGTAEEGYTRFYINLGTVKKLQAHNLIGLINEKTKNRNIPIGKIDIMRNFSFFEVSSEFKEKILSAFKKSNWNGNNVVVEESKNQTINYKKKNLKEINFIKNKRRKNENINSFKQKFKNRKRKK